jgi:hypothetical protein
MRVAVLAAFIVLSACASSGLSLAPPAGVDLSGHWKLNEAESDNPMHLLQAANNQAIANAGNSGSSGGGGRGGGRGGGQQATGYPRLQQPATPSIGALTEGFHFPGKIVDIKQVSGVVTFTSEGKNRVCQPSNANKHARHGGADRDVPMAAREVGPPMCGWSDKTLIVRSREPDEERPPFEEHYSLSEDGVRLVEEISFSGGRSNGFVMSRVWERVAP